MESPFRASVEKMIKWEKRTVILCLTSTLQYVTVPAIKAMWDALPRANAKIARTHLECHRTKLH